MLSQRVQQLKKRVREGKNILQLKVPMKERRGSRMYFFDF